MTPHSRRRRAAAIAQSRQTSPLLGGVGLAALLLAGALVLAAAPVRGQELATGDDPIGTDPIEPPGIDTVVGDDPNLGAEFGRDVYEGPFRDRGVGLESGVEVERDLGVMTKSPNIDGPISSQRAEVIDDDETLVGNSDDAATLNDDIADDDDDPLGAASPIGDSDPGLLD